MQTRDFGPLFVHMVKLTKDAPLFHRADAHELEEPFRVSRPLVVRVWPGKGLVLGWWRDSDLDETTALLRALQGRGEGWGDEVAEKFR